MTAPSTRSAPLKRLLSSLAAVIAVTAIFGAKAYEAERAYAASHTDSAKIASVR